MLILKASALQMRMDRGPEEFELLPVYSVKLPPPFGYSLLSKRESFSLCYSICYQSSSSWIRGGGRQAGGV